MLLGITGTLLGQLWRVRAQTLIPYWCERLLRGGHTFTVNGFENLLPSWGNLTRPFIFVIWYANVFICKL